MSIAPVMSSSHLILWRPLLLLPSIFPSIKDSSIESAVLIRWPKYWSFSPSNEYSGMISFRIDWFDLLAVLRDSQESFPEPCEMRAGLWYSWWEGFFCFFCFWLVGWFLAIPCGCGNLVPRLGIKPGPWAMTEQVLNTGSPGNSPVDGHYSWSQSFNRTDDIYS